MKAATFSRIIFFVSILVVSLSCSGSDSHLTDSVGAYALSLASFEKARRELENAIEECDNKRKIVPPSLITPFGMDLEQTQLALSVLNRRAEDTCEKGSRERLFYTANIHTNIARHYDLDAGEAIDYSTDLLFLRHWEYLELEAKYLELDLDTRKGLESVRELQVPFFMFKTLDGLKINLAQ